MQEPGRQFTTDLDFHDMRIGGGNPIDAVITLLAPPASQSQLLHRALTSEQPLVYLSPVVRDPEALEAWLAAPRPEPDEIPVIYTPAETIAETLHTSLQLAPPESFLVIDDIDVLETGAGSEYRDLFNVIHTWVREHESVAFLHGLDTGDVGPHRSLTLNRVD